MEERKEEMFKWTKELKTFAKVCGKQLLEGMIISQSPIPPLPSIMSCVEKGFQSIKEDEKQNLTKVPKKCKIERETDTEVWLICKKPMQ